MKRAYIGIREFPHYRHDAFVAGLKVLGFHCNMTLPSGPPDPGDVLVIWNRYSDKEGAADKWEADGGTVLVAENGYCGVGPGGRQYYALARHGHNGSGSWPSGDGNRWAAFGIEPQPWRANGEHILVCGQRGIGSKTMASPTDWHGRVAADIHRATKRPLRIRQHPGNEKPTRTLDEDLAGAHSCVIWSSSSGIKALIAGIPVYYDAPHWICERAALRARGADWERPLKDDAARLKALERMAWAQWTVEELQSGEPFRRLLEPE